MKQILLFSLSLIVLPLFSQQLFFNDFDNNDDFRVVSTGHSFIVSPTTGQVDMNSWYTNSMFLGGTITVGNSSFNIDDTPSQTGTNISSPNGVFKHIVGFPGKSQNILNANMQIESPLTNQLPFQSDFIEMNNSINTSNMANVSCNFYWIGDGGRGFLYYSIDDGANWELYTDNSNDTVTYNEFTDWSLQTVQKDIFNNQTTLKFGFLFDNSDAALDNEPAFSIDDVFIANAPIEFNNDTLKTDISAISYKWINCSTNAEIGTGSSFYPLVGGDYKVELTYEGGIVSSKCLAVVISSIHNTKNIFTSIFPNPANDELLIQLSNTSTFSYTITNVLGTEILKMKELTTSSFSLNTSSFPSGIYFLNINIKGQTKTTKFLVQH